MPNIMTQAWNMVKRVFARSRDVEFDPYHLKGRQVIAMGEIKDEDGTMTLRVREQSKIAAVSSDGREVKLHKDGPAICLKPRILSTSCSSPVSPEKTHSKVDTERKMMAIILPRISKQQAQV
jgi:hypothetical protein